MSRETAPFPQRIFLDSSVLQTMLRYGGFIYCGETVRSDDRIFRDPRGYSKLESLHDIALIGDRAPFEFALSEGSFIEVRRAKDASYLRWAYDVLDHWNVCLAEAGPSEPDRLALAKLGSSSFDQNPSMGGSLPVSICSNPCIERTSQRALRAGCAAAHAER